ncbi:pre-mRNA cleavage complex 2 protein Pcf11 [Halyomorpha halys]|uniref:pre-mRNA cleavage complex 2 protein Pcf11 n=1 Tax=Halyomorpha halys TaxID=286706 RepID=UPI0006D527DB|nr:uncharacterized protein LOC106684165 [Halyomorpha halys]
MYQHTKVKGVAEEYTSSLTDLTVNSKPLINMLTMLAEDYIEHAPTIVRAVEAHLQKVNGDVKLPVLYLIDSIVKNVAKEYVSLFTQNIVSTFCTVFEQVDEKTRSQMFKLRQTWNEVFPPKKLYALDARVNAIDPAWPITANPPHGRIHVNPKFLNPVPQVFTTPEATQNITDGAMREELLKKQKELLELQKRKVELELLQTKAILEEQQKKLENQTASFKTEPLPSNVEKPKITPDVPEPFPPIKTKNSTDTNRENKSAFDSSRVRDPRLRLKKINTKRPNDPTFNIPERIKSGKINIFNEENSTKYSEENRNVVNSDFNGIKRSERSDRRTERRQKKYKEHKSRPKPVSDVHGSVDPNRGKIIASELIKQKELPQTVVDPTTISFIADKYNISNVSKESDNKSEEADKTKTKISPSKSRVRSKGKEKIKRKIESPVSAVLPIEEETTRNHTEVHSTIVVTDETSLHSRSSIHDMDISMEVEEKPHIIEESKIKEYTPLIPKEEAIIPLTTCSNDATVNNPNLPAKSMDPAIDSFRDIDLRLLPQSKTEPEQPPEKKSKAEIQKLFGEEDVDLRKFPPPTPPTPPPPVISNSLDLINDVEITNGWANFKRSSTDTTSPNKSPNKSKKMKTSFSCPKVSFFNKEEEDPEESSSLKFSEQESEGRSHSYCFIMKQAEEQLQNETITFAEYNQILKGVMSMNEERKLQEAILKDEMEMVDSPGDAAVSSVTSESVNIDKEDSYNSPDLDDDMKSVGSDSKTDVSDSQFEKSKNSNEAMINSFSDHGNENNLRKRSHFKDQFHRGKEPRHRYFNSDPYFLGKNVLCMMRPPPPNFVHRPPRKEMMFNRWPYQNFNRAPFDSKRINFNQLSRMRNIRHPHDMSLPSADPNVLEMIKSDPMTYVNVGGMSKEIRFYGENAIIMLDWDDPRDLMFQPGSRRVFIDGVDILTLQFNSQYREITLTDGIRIRIRLGAPTRELFIDGRFYDVKFGGPPVEINLGGRTHLIQLEGPLPFLKIGPTKRTDLVAGKVNLIVDGNIDNMFPVYLDAKPQRFEIGNVPFIIRFVEALQTVVINGQPFKIQFGGLPVPIFFRGEKHFLRLTSLPTGITPGYVNILNMEGGRLPTPPPPRTPPPPQINGFEPSVAPPGFIKQNLPGEIQQGLIRPVLPVTYFNPDYQLYNGTPGVEPSVDVLTSLMTPPTAPNFSQVPTQNYVVEPSQENTAASATPAAITASTPDINVSELYKKLVAIGVVPPLKEKEKENTENRLAVKPVDFSKPETLKVRQPGLINRLYSGIQCSSCGVRFAPEQTVKHSQHLDWHFRQNRRERHSSKIALSRKWNYDVSDWIQYQEIEDLEDRAQSWFEMQDKKVDVNEKEEKDEPTVPAKGFGENPCCTVCRDKFDQFFNEEKEEWQLKMAISVDEKLYHPLCYKDEQESEGRNVGEMLMNIQEELHSIETIVIDDSIANEDERKIDPDADSKEESHKDISGKTDGDNLEQNRLKDESSDEPFVPAGPFEENPICVICSEKIEKFFCEEKKELFLKPAICMNEKLYHPHCFEEQHEIQLEKQLNEKEEINEHIETIVVDDSITISNEGGNIEEIDLETVNMSTDEPVQEVTEKSEVSDCSMRQDDSDDDILEIEVLKPNIESYEILDDDDEDEIMKDESEDFENAETNSKDRLEMDTSGNESESDNVTVKTEKIDLVNLNLPGNPSHVTETISLDGNSEFSAPTILLPKKIKINISSIIQKNNVDDISNDQQNNSNNVRIEENSIAFNNSEPLPPGEDLYPAHLKPKLVGKRLAEVNAVNKGKELSGLCSIM